MSAFRPNLFYALWPNETTRTQLARLQTPLRGRLTRAQNLHLTLAFLGPQPETLLPILRSILRHLSAKPLALDIDLLGYFTQNRIAWAGMHTITPELVLLQRTLAQALESKGIPFDSSRIFRPHITLARNADALADLPFEPIRWRADCVVLAQSPSPGEQPFYQVLATQTLKPDSE